MKIILNVGSLSFGGAERVAVDLANGLSRRGHKVIVLVNLNKRVSYRLDESVDVRHFDSRRILSCFKPVWEYSRIIRMERPDAILGFGSYQSFIAKLSQVLSLVRPLVIYTEHNVLERPLGVKFPFQEKFYKFYFSRVCDAMTVLTEADKAFVKGKLKNVHVMPNPMGLVPTQKIGTRKNIILAVGRFNVWYIKGFDILIQAWGKICRKYTDWELHIIGSGEIQDQVRLLDFAKDFGCENRIHLLPFTDDIAPVYLDSSIFVLSSRYEGFGLVLTEAMSQGCACIAADYKGRQSEIITHEVDGLLCPTDDPNAIADQIECLINDEQLRFRLQSSAIERSKDFSVEGYAIKWERLILKLKNE